ncbi:undecaprenyl-phosphate glucose phosphotransferase [Echinicola marina]|uniref:undecaprenyl-phosphate glucose phosphotransferase n=1 Tax=Echinicola marina TaxID=2859768 RepID=UPI001CF611AC|nr:undecaprenyl-phosphate glucose phosphotransferase [Echinicola marina]UCS92975.1 undecaprenyl-phosphate glucose phosphotransferase [Echinicola marina]
MNSTNRFVSGIFFVWDVITLGLTFLLSIYLSKENGVQSVDWLLFFALTSLWFIIVIWRKLYLFEYKGDYSSRIFNYVKASAILVVLFGLIYLIFTFPPTFRKVVIYFSIGFPLIGISTNFIILSIINRINQNGNGLKNVLVTGKGEMVNKVNTYYKGHPNLGYQIKGFIRYKEDDLEKENTYEAAGYVSDVSHMGDYIAANPVDEIIVALPVKCSKEIKKILKTADYYGTRVRFVPDYGNILGKEYKVVRKGALDMVNVRQMPLDNKWSFFLKECFDWIFSSVALLMLSPIFIVVAILIKLDSPGPVFYCPVRIGQGSKPFRVFKFRTMKKNDETGKVSTKFNDPRITKIGKILRKYSIDELPQFANVFMGHMSVVGPRPHRSFLNQEFQKNVDKAMVRHYFKPGITGWAQVNGWRGPTETFEQKEQRIMHDLWYLEHWTMCLDLKIIYLTIFSRKTHKNSF